MELQLASTRPRRPATLGARQAEAADPRGAGILRDGALHHPKAYREKVGPKEYSQRRSAPAPTRSPRSSPASPSISSASRITGPAARRASRRSRRSCVRFVPDAATEMTELLAGRADWIWNMNPDQLDTVEQGCRTCRRCARSRCASAICRIDAAGRTGADNPLTKLKVRQAIWHAIDRQAIADKLVTGGSRVPPAPCFPTQFGCDAEAAVQYDYDPAKAKQLLAEAGYPERLRGRACELRAAAMGRGGAELPACGRHPRQAQPAPGRRR